MKKEAVVILAEGFEDIEAITPIDILRRAGINVVVAGVGKKIIKGARGIKVECDMVLSDYDIDADVVVLPGGMPGADNLAASIDVKNTVRSAITKKRLIAAICASPALVLAPMGVLDGRKATCYPGMEKNFPSSATHSKDNVVVDGNIITSKGVGTALEFAIKIVEKLAGKEVAKLVSEAVLF
ncbi:MAG: DJ-1/PfpI family protein [Candidatus Omnitrophica bacterium]|nr:DJ-1/PfpI family protein [Candidatus Omnitrophota bacterium]